MKVLYIQPIHPSGMEKLREKYEVAVAGDTRRETLVKALADADAAVTRLTAVDRGLMAAAPRLKAVAKHGVGVDNIDTEYAKEHGIAVLTTDDANSSTVAEHTMFAIGALFKRIPMLDGQMRKGNWLSRDLPGARDVMGKTLGIIGFGRIGQNLARMAGQGFRMKVAVYDPFARREEVEKQGFAYYDDLLDMAATLDVVSPHVPLTTQTAGMIGADFLSAMKTESFVVNFARGGVVNEDALYEALMSGHIAGAAVDVFETEPPDIRKPLYCLPNVLLSPHCATFTEDSRIRMSMRLAEEIDQVLSPRLIR